MERLKNKVYNMLKKYERLFQEQCDVESLKREMHEDSQQIKTAQSIISYD